MHTHPAQISNLLPLGYRFTTISGLRGGGQHRPYPDKLQMGREWTLVRREITRGQPIGSRSRCLTPLCGPGWQNRLIRSVTLDLDLAATVITSILNCKAVIIQKEEMKYITLSQQSISVNNIQSLRQRVQIRLPRLLTVFFVLLLFSITNMFLPTVVSLRFLWEHKNV